MKKFILVLILLTTSLFAGPPDSIVNYLQDISVTIRVEDKQGNLQGEGSGVIKTRMIDEKLINFVWTAAHVVESLRYVTTKIDPATGSYKKKVLFRDAYVIKELVENGRRVGEYKMDARVIKYSSEQDLALLMIRKTNFVKSSVVFDLDNEYIKIGTTLYHVGSLLGQVGANSMTSGIMSKVGRTIGDFVYDQTTVTAFPGSSGGGVYTTDGKYIGMIVRGAGEGFNFIVPMRRMIEWAKEVRITWAINDKVAPPSLKRIRRMKIEDMVKYYDTGNRDEHKTFYKEKK